MNGKVLWAIVVSEIVFMPGPASAQTPSPPPATSPGATPSPPGGYLPDTSSTFGFVLLLVLIGVLVLAWLVPYMADVILAYRRWDGTAPGAQEQGPPGIPGLVRSLLALIVTTVVALTLVLVLAGNAADATDLRQTLIAAIVSISGTVAGFYFGGKTAENTAAAVAAAAAKAEGTVTLTPSSFDFTPQHDEQVFLVSNLSSEDTELRAASISDPQAGFEIVAPAAPGEWDGITITRLAAGAQVGLRVRWSQQPASTSAVLTIAHSGRGAPSAELTGTP